VLTSLGVSNVSFGFKPAARAVLNSVFLYHCVAAGLDMAIVNPKHITPYAEIPAEQRELADDLIFNRRPDALARFINFFEAVKLQTSEAVDETAGLPPEQRVHWRILHRKKEQVQADLDELLERLVRESAGVADFQQQPDFHFPNAHTSKAVVWILNQVLLPAMKEVGDKFGAGELIFGSPDDMKFRSCMTLFSRTAEKHSVFQENLMKYFSGKPDPLTTNLLRPGYS